ncbi:MAG TPA: phosphoribosyltransferase [Bryobacteraceae bacterium]|jgi:putative phosphoribosyl transferase|nr:phosphoribosyltransferase [Bryobacteraceae bacterium]
MPATTPLFRNRADAGKILAARVEADIGDTSALVLGLPRGGVPVAFEVAQTLHGDLDVFTVRKLGVPTLEEMAMGAIASGGVRFLNRALIHELGISQAEVEQVTAREWTELQGRERLYREGRPPLEVEDRTIILVDDGLATGASMHAAARALRAWRPKEIIIAVPVAARQTCDDLRRDVDRIICAATPEPFYAVGAWYEDFTQTTDAEVRDLLERSARERVP